MRRNFKKRNVILASVALALTASLSVGSAMAYFTTYANAKGGVPVKLGFTETIPKDEVDELGKHVSITNTGDYGCYVRAKVFSVVDVEYSLPEDWENGDDGYFYYIPILQPGETTSVFDVSYTFPQDEDTSEFDIVVIQECTPILYTDDGEPYADWSRVVTEDTEVQD